MTHCLDRSGSRWSSLAGLVTLAGLIFWAPPLPAAPADEARQILSATGVKGGLVVHVGCGDGQITAALKSSDSFLVHGLAFDEASASAARGRVQSLGLYGPVAIELWKGPGLPYADNLVNLLVAEDLHGVPMEEVLRVLTPGGAACLRREGKWTATIKPRPATIDDWTHALHDANNNAVSKDMVVGPPQHLQWVADPRHMRHHEMQASMSVVVSGGGRLFYIIDEAPTGAVLLPSQWQLVARDAFNGVLLWKRPISTWESQFRGKSDGPPELARRLVAGGERVYVTLGLDAPVVALDAATGQTVKTYAGTEATQEILHHDGVLYVVVGKSGPAKNNPAKASGGKEVSKSSRDVWPGPNRVLALEEASGRVLWKKNDAQPVPMSLATGEKRVFWLAPDGVVCVDAETGSEVWRARRDVVSGRPPWSAPTLVVQGDTVLCADRRVTAGPDIDEVTGKKVSSTQSGASGLGDLVVYSIRDGQRLWTAKCAETYCAPNDVFVNDGLVWLGQSRARVGPQDYTAGMDLLTGNIKHRLPPNNAFETTMTHHRCYRDVATPRYLLVGRTGVAFIDLKTGETVLNHWIRGVCQYGVIPANGLLYVPPNACACYSEAKVPGLLALAPAEKPALFADQGGRLEQGPAYGSIPNSEFRIPNSQDWPAYRHDPARSGCASTTVSDDLKCAWQAKLGGRLSSPVIANNRVLLASIETHTVHALDATSGQPVWQFTAGGRIDSPPAVAEGLAVFGSADGWVYCLRASDGQLAWRYRAAPQERRVVAQGQIESTWPAEGSVLVQNSAVYCAAGRSSYLDGGIRLARLDLKTGRSLAQQTVFSLDPRTGQQPKEPLNYELPGGLPDILSCQGDLVFMRHLAFAPQDLSPRKAPAHLYSPAGFLDDDWWHRTYWIFGDHFYSGYIGWYFAGREAPAGRLLVVDKSSIYGFGYKPKFYAGARQAEYQLFAINRPAVPLQPTADYIRANKDYPHRLPGKFVVPIAWSNDVPHLARALVLAGDLLVLAGPPNEALESPAAFKGSQGALLSAVSARDGKTRAEYRLDALPVFDGLAAAQGRLYLTLQDGRLLCLGDRRSISGGQELPRVAAPARPAGP